MQVPNHGQKSRPRRPPRRKGAMHGGGLSGVFSARDRRQLTTAPQRIAGITMTDSPCPKRQLVIRQHGFQQDHAAGVGYEPGNVVAIKQHAELP